MKKLIAALFLIIFTGSLASAQVWSSIDYKYSNGPVSPKYQKSYIISVSTDRYVTLTYTSNTDGAKSDSYSRKLSKSQMRKFNKKLNASGFLDINYTPNFTDNMKVGGSTKNITINYSGKRMPLELNERLGDKGELEQFESLAAYMEKLIPAKVMKKFNSGTTE
ncbi:hypothetical protein BH10BAC5_BH10BAC5_05920 [soil metagenome]